MPRLDQLLARNLGCSRSKARQLIDAREAKREIPEAELPLHFQLPDGPIDLYDRFHLALNKPTGLVTALYDPIHRTVRELVREAPLYDELRPAGRLDMDTTGLLIWTSDGTWLHKITHPRSRIPRTYHAALARPFRTPGTDLLLDDGHRPEIGEIRVIEAADAHPSLAQSPEATTYATITIVGGAYHEVRRIFAALGSHVLGLCRVRFGRLALPNDLPLGEWIPISPLDV